MCDDIQIQYFSDVHTEFYTSNPGKIKRLNIRPEAKYLILAGDIGNPSTQTYTDFIALMSTMYEYVILVSGNHEYYAHKHACKLLDGYSDQLKGKEWINAVDARIRHVCSGFKNVLFLQNEVFAIPDTNIVVYGGTAWTNIKASEEQDIIRTVADYKCIPGFTPDICRQLHQAFVEELQRVLKESSYVHKSFVIVSHHLPSYTLIHPKYRQTDINSAFASDIIEANDEIICAWFAGHTHTAITKGKYYVNPIGYPGENIQNDFNKTAMVMVSTS